MLTHGSLFAGIGGFDLGFERAGIKTVWQVEIDPFCRKVLERHFPDARRYHNIKRVKRFAAVDIIGGGFPCQDISQAGRRRGIDGKRSGLWSEMWRVIRIVRPRYVVVENVSALLHRGIERVIGDLASIGYDAEWDCIPACAVGAPHIRDRVWIIAYPAGDLWRASGDDGPAASDRGGAIVADSQSLRAQGRIQQQRDGFPGQDGNQGKLANADQQGLEGRKCQILPERAGERLAGQSGASVAYSHIQPTQRPSDAWRECNPWIIEPDVGRVAHGIPARVDRLKGLGNAVVPQIAEWIGRRIVEAAK